MRKYIFILSILLIIGSCKAPTYVLNAPVKEINYSLSENWACLPSKIDSADAVPDINLINNQSNAEIDVFYIYPTTFFGKGTKKKWNAEIDDEKLNEHTDIFAIRNQATIFNGVGKIYVPRYRQAHLRSFFTKDRESAEKALNIAWNDIKIAFQYYLDNYNNGRPIIIAGHSQGALLGSKILEEFFDDKPLKQKLVVAYIPGYPFEKDKYQNIPVCETPEEIGCFCVWRTVKYGTKKPKKIPLGENLAVVNPLSWKTDTIEINASQNKGAVLYKFYDGLAPNLFDAKIYSGILWTHKPKFKGSWLIQSNNYHRGDFNLYYQNIRENAKLRTSNYLKKTKQ